MSAADISDGYFDLLSSSVGIPVPGQLVVHRDTEWGEEAQDKYAVPVAVGLRGQPFPGSQAPSISTAEIFLPAGILCAHTPLLPAAQDISSAIPQSTKAPFKLSPGKLFPGAGTSSSLPQTAWERHSHCSGLPLPLCCITSALQLHAAWVSGIATLSLGSRGETATKNHQRSHRKTQRIEWKPFLPQPLQAQPGLGN